MIKFESTAQKERVKTIGLSMLITLVSMLIFWWIFPPRFTETTDDMLMASFSYGYMGEYYAKLVYINSIVGFVLKICMKLVPWFPWYTFAQCMIIYLSHSTIMYLILKRFSGNKAIFPVSFIIIYFGYEFFSNLQFTKTATIAVVAGFLMMFYAVSEKRYWYTHIWAGILIFVGRYRTNIRKLF